MKCCLNFVHSDICMKMSHCQIVYKCYRNNILKINFSLLLAQEKWGLSQNSPSITVVQSFSKCFFRLVFDPVQGIKYHVVFFFQATLERSVKCQSFSPHCTLIVTRLRSSPPADDPSSSEPSSPATSWRVSPLLQTTKSLKRWEIFLSIWNCGLHSGNWYNNQLFWLIRKSDFN